MRKLSVLLILSILSILSTGCVNPYCADMQNKRIDSATFDQCTKEKMMVPGRMGIVPAAEIDACAAKAAHVTKQLCGM